MQIYVRVDRKRNSTVQNNKLWNWKCACIVVCESVGVYFCYSLHCSYTFHICECSSFHFSINLEIKRQIKMLNCAQRTDLTEVQLTARYGWLSCQNTHPPCREPTKYQFWFQPLLTKTWSYWHVHTKKLKDSVLSWDTVREIIIWSSAELVSLLTYKELNSLSF